MNSIIYFNPESGNVASGKTEGYVPYISTEEWDAREEQYKESQKQQEQALKVAARMAFGGAVDHEDAEIYIGLLRTIVLCLGFVPGAQMLVKWNVVVGVTLFIIILGVIVGACVKSVHKRRVLTEYARRYQKDVVKEIVKFAKNHHEDMEEGGVNS